MAKIRLSIEDRKDIFLYKTRIENLFISEFLPDAPGDYVKVFLLGYMYAQYGEEIAPEKLSMCLDLSEEEIDEAWIYWESRGVIRRRKSIDENGEKICRVEFLRLIDEFYGRNAAEDGSEQEELSPGHSFSDDAAEDGGAAGRLIDSRLRDLYSKYQTTTGRTVSRQETGKIEDAIKLYGIEPEIFDFAIDYCADLEKYSIDYIFKVALRWTEDGCRTIEEAKRLLDRHSLRNSYYSQVFKAMGWSRLPAPADREIMDKWFDEMKCSIGEVLDACRASGGIRDPNLRYVNKVLENRRLEKGGINTRAARDTAAYGQSAQTEQTSGEGSLVSRKVLNDYYEYIRAVDEEAWKIRVREIRAGMPGMKELFEEEASMNAKLLSIKPGVAGQDERQRLRAERLAVERKKKKILAANGFPPDYLDRKYRCEKCRDTGYTDEGMVCSCCRERAEEAYKWIQDKSRTE